MTRTSNSLPLDNAAIASSRFSGDSALDCIRRASYRIVAGPGPCGPGPEPFSPDVYPVERAFHRLLPLGVAVGALLVVPSRLPALRLVPVLAQFVGRLPEADRQAGRVGRTQGGGLRDDRPADRYAEDVRLHLHAQVVGGDAA